MVVGRDLEHLDPLDLSLLVTQWDHKDIINILLGPWHEKIWETLEFYC